MNPRRFLLAAAFIGFTSASDASTTRVCTPIPEHRIAFQLATLRSAFVPADALVSVNSTHPPPRAGTARPPILVRPADESAFESTLAALRDIGFSNMERFGGTLNLPFDRYRSLVEASDIRVIGSHDSLADDQAEQTLAQARSLHQQYVGSWGFGDIGLDSLDNVLATAAYLNRFGKAAAAAGMRLIVHNHGVEFTSRYEIDLEHTGRRRPVSAWEIVAARTDPDLVHFELDIHWARLALGGEQPLLDFLRRYRDRIELLHVKDTAADGSVADLGQGITDWSRVFDAAGPQVRYYIWEFDNPPDPLASARIAYRYLRCEL